MRRARETCEVIEEARGPALDFDARFAQRLALLDRDDAGEALAVRPHQIPDTLEEAGTFSGCQRRPRRLGAPRGLQRRMCVLVGRNGHVGNWHPARRVDHLHRLAALGANPGLADPHPEVSADVEAVLHSGVHNHLLHVPATFQPPSIKSI